VLRRSEGRHVDGDLLRVSDLEIDAVRMSVRRGGEPVDLTPTEFQILATLARHPGRVFTRAQLLEAARGTDAEAYERAIDSHVKNIRRKLEPDPHAPRYLESVYGIGYKLVEE